MSLQGNFSDLPLIDLLQVLSLQKKTGILSISREFSQAQIFFNASQLYSAHIRHGVPSGTSALHLDGEEAIYDLLSWNDGYFVFEISNILPTAQNITHTWNYLVLEHCRRLDAKESQLQLINYIDFVPLLVDNIPAHSQISLSPGEWQILLRVNGQLTIREIATQVPYALEQVTNWFKKLKLQGLIVWNRKPAALPTPVQSPLILANKDELPDVLTSPVQIEIYQNYNALFPASISSH